jgi:ubiquinone/menaquinone biosynthesis C-methylase UbiE
VRPRRSQSDVQRPTAWQRLAGKGVYPIEYASWLLSPLRYLVMPPRRIADRLELSPTDHVLEIGCGPGFFSATIAKTLSGGQLTLFDAQEPMLDLASARMHRHNVANFACVSGDACKLPFRDNAFDVVLMVTVLGEVSDRVAATAEAARVLRPNGRLSITEAAGDPDRVKPAELDHLAARAGLTTDKSWRGVMVATNNYRKLSPFRPAQSDASSGRLIT